MKFLIIAPHFWPENGVATQRISSFSRYLLNNNHQVSVITNKKGSKVVYKKLENYFEVDGCDLTRSSYKVFKYNQNLYRYELERVLNMERYDVVLFTGGPFFTFSLTKECKEKNIFCLLDFRDPWSFDYRGLKDVVSIKRIAKRMVFALLERRAIKHANAVTTVTQGWVDRFKRSYLCQKEKFFLIENGYDDDRLRNICLSNEFRKNHGVLTLGVFGKLFYYSDYYSKVFLNAIKIFCDSSDSNVKMLQVGDKESVCDELIMNANLDLDILECTGLLSYEDGIAAIAGTDICLIIDSRKKALGTKLYDYIFLGKTIIYVGPRKSAFSEVLKQYGKAYICSTVKEVVCALDSFSKANDGGNEDRNIYKDKFSRSYSNKKWLTLIEELVEKR